MIIIMMNQTIPFQEDWCLPQCYLPQTEPDFDPNYSTYFDNYGKKT